MTNSILTGWNISRVLRLVLGTIIIIQGVQSTAWLSILAGALFTLMALLNIGCCGSGACSVPISKIKNKTNDINYEEVR